MRLRKLKNVEERLAASDVVLKDPFAYKGRWKEYFKNENPIYLEIGMGKGQFLIAHARQNPDINYIGIEKEASVMVKACEKVTENIPNLVMLNVDAKDILEIFGEAEVEKLFLNFSDPWPKSRHTKRRLTYSENLENYKNIVSQKGSIEFKTDNRHLFEFSLQAFVENGYSIVKLSLNLHEDEAEVITTEYEDRFLALGNIIYYVEVKHGKNEIV